LVKGLEPLALINQPSTLLPDGTESNAVNGSPVDSLNEKRKPYPLFDVDFKLQ
jgi:hypothetical protein